MEAACPHLGAPLENAPIQAGDDQDDVEDLVVVWWDRKLTQQYDFQLSTGESSTGLSSCVFPVKIEDGAVWIDFSPSQLRGWQIVELRPVSEAFAQLPADDTNAERGEVNDGIHSFDWSSIPRPDPIPRTLCEWASRILSTSDPLEKVAYTQYAGQAFRQGECRVIARGRWNHDLQWTTPPKEQPPIRPPRPESVRCVKPGAEGKRGKAGTERSRIALLHALANIEQWAIDLAWDALAARTETNPCPQSTLPVQFYTDFVKIAIDEAKHFTLLQKRLMELGSYFGELPVHHGLWDSAMETSENLFARLSRGLDVNPVTIRKFQAAGDQASVAALNVIHLDEITHVSAGHRWLTYLCANHPTPLNPIDVFRDEVRKNFVGRLKGPFNESDRMQAGLSKAWYDGLSGEKASRHAQGVHREEVPGG